MLIRYLSAALTMCMVLVAPVIWSAEATVPHTFSAGSRIVAREMNENFAAVLSHINSHPPTLKIVDSGRRPVGETLDVDFLRGTGLVRFGIAAAGRDYTLLLDITSAGISSPSVVLGEDIVWESTDCTGQMWLVRAPDEQFSRSLGFSSSRSNLFWIFGGGSGPAFLVVPTSTQPGTFFAQSYAFSGVDFPNQRVNDCQRFYQRGPGMPVEFISRAVTAWPVEYVEDLHQRFVPPFDAISATSQNAGP